MKICAKDEKVTWTKTSVLNANPQSDEDFQGEQLQTMPDALLKRTVADRLSVSTAILRL